MDLLNVKNICKSYVNHRALDNINIDIPRSSIFGLLGPNGAGKTTLIRIINQIINQDSGQILLHGTNINYNDIRKIGYMPEERGLYKKMKIGDFLLFMGKLKGLSRSESINSARDWFNNLEVSNWWNKNIEDLSKGMSQKVQFISTVLHNPDLIILDEPFSGFDPVNANLIKKNLLRLKDEGKTIIFSTHRMESVEELCDYIALINKSNKILDGKLDEIKREYQTNTFEVGLVTNRKSEIEKEIKNNFQTSKPTFKGLGDNLRLNILLKESQTSDELLNFLVKKAKIQHFKEVIPSANDIFIKSVKEN